MASHASLTHLNSLPLMGIGNICVLAAGALLYLLITPHGDREQIRSWPVRKGDVNSLPLMGIGNLSQGTTS